MKLHTEEAQWTPEDKHRDPHRNKLYSNYWKTKTNTKQQEKCREATPVTRDPPRD